MPLTVSDEILCEIGRIAVYQSHIENQMAFFIHELLYLDESRGHLITAKLSFRDLVDLLHSLLRDEFGSDHDYFNKFEGIRKELASLEENRNVFIHSMWGFGSTLGPDSATRVKVVKNTKGAKLDSVDVRLEDLKKVSKEMDHLEWAIGDLRVRVCHHKKNARKIPRL